MIKTFEDLEFKLHGWAPDSFHAVLNFDNNYGVSVLFGDTFYSNTALSTYEVGILYKNFLCYTIPLTDDVIGYCTESEVTEIMKKVQEL